MVKVRNGGRRSKGLSIYRAHVTRGCLLANGIHSQQGLCQFDNAKMLVE
jgi:hypothetical protein